MLKDFLFIAGQSPTKDNDLKYPKLETTFFMLELGILLPRALGCLSLESRSEERIMLVQYVANLQ